MRNFILSYYPEKQKCYQRYFTKKKTEKSIYPREYLINPSFFQWGIKKAANPVCVFWQNLHAKYNQKLKARIITAAATGLFVAINLGVLLALKVSQKKLTQEDMKEDIEEGEPPLLPILRIRIVSVVMMIFIAVVNAVIARVLRALTLKEMHSAAPVFFRRVMIKLIVVEHYHLGTVHQHQNLDHRVPFRHHRASSRIDFHQRRLAQRYLVHPVGSGFYHSPRVCF